MKTKKSKCRVCEKPMKLFHKQHNFGKSYPEYKNPKASSYGKRLSFSRWDSEDGILFNTNKFSGVWFCNSCWKQIISKVKFED